MATNRRRPNVTARRKRVWVRQATPVTLTGTTPLQIDMLGSLSLIGREPPVGATIGGVRFGMSFNRTVGLGANDRITVGMLVGNVLNDADDQNPAVSLDLDWMFYRRFYAASINDPALTPTPPGPTFAYDDVQVRSMRRLEEYQQTFWMVLAGGLAGSTWVGDVTTSTLLILP